MVVPTAREPGTRVLADLGVTLRAISQQFGLSLTHRPLLRCRSPRRDVRVTVDGLERGMLILQTRRVEHTRLTGTPARSLERLRE